MKHFKASFIVTAVGLILAYLWGEHVHAGTGLMCIFITFVLSVLEVSLSFDNAVVNAMKLETMTEVWRKRFITWGMAIAVFGMRFLFPLLIVSIFAKLNIANVLQIAITDSKLYALHLHQTHAPIVTFGGAFLLMLFLNYFLNKNKELDWLPIEKIIKKVPSSKLLSTVITLFIVDSVHIIQPPPIRLKVLMSGIIGILIYLFIDTISNKLESLADNKSKGCCNGAKMASYSCFASFMYLELIDASFSLDGVLGAFALSSDIVIITIGLAIGAMFVRSLTILLVEEKTLASYPFLEHGAHWAIGVLAVIMFLSTVINISEIITGMSGLIIIICSLISSIKYRKKGE